MRIEVNGPFRGPSGHDRHMREFVRAMVRLGAQVQLKGVEGWSYTMFEASGIPADWVTRAREHRRIVVPTDVCHQACIRRGGAGFPGGGVPFRSGWGVFLQEGRAAGIARTRRPPRTVELRHDFTIGAGATAVENRWMIEDDKDGCPLLSVRNENGAVTEL